MRESSKQNIYSHVEESEASKSYNNILKEIAESQGNTTPVSTNSSTVHFSFPEYLSSHCYNDIDKNTSLSISDSMPLIVNNIVAHQHLPTETNFSIKPAHSSSLTKKSIDNLPNNEGAVPLIYKSDHDHERGHHENQRQNLRNLILNLKDGKPFLTGVTNNSDGNSIGIETASQNHHNENPIFELWTHKLNTPPVENSTITDYQADSMASKNGWYEMLDPLGSNKVTQNDGGTFVKYDKPLLLQPNPISTNFMLVSNPKLTEVTENNHWEDFSNNKRHGKQEKDEGSSKSENQAHQLQDIPSMESWNASQQSHSQANVESWLSQDQMRDEHDHHLNLNSYHKNYSNYTDSQCPKSEIWEKKPEKEMLESHSISEKENSEIKRSWMQGVVHNVDRNIDMTLSIDRGDSGISIKQENTLPCPTTVNMFSHSVIQDLKMEGSKENVTYIPNDETTPGRKNIRKSTHAEAQSHSEKPWDENKNNNKPSSDATTSWSLGNTAPQASDRTTGDVWNYQTMTSVMENGHYHPIKHSSQDDGLHPEQESYNHSEPSTPPTKLVEGREMKRKTASVVTQPEQPPHPTAPSDGGKDREVTPGLSSASDTVMVSTFGSMAPYSMAGNYSSPPSYSGRDLYPGKPSSGYSVDGSSPSSTALYASSSGSLAMIPYVAAGQSMTGHQSMVSQSGHHWSGSQPPSVHDHQQSSGYGISALTSGLNLAAQNSLMATSQAGGCDQNELSRAAGFSSFASSGHSYLRPEMTTHWGLIDPIPGLQHPYCSDGMAHHLNQGKSILISFLC
ncbi:GATA-binding factor A [Trichonephila clavata]|uniref:GATA-binding factor A n=1 Tax=Trichonephila clavata TaxID=2740835 RepID=A0A8X6F7W2_TRICU|nr:GATA-binding factor A [Trichonephila clavata]